MRRTGHEPDDLENRPQQLDDLFVLRKDDMVATCELWTHQHGHECRLFAGEDMIAAQVCESPDEIALFRDRWCEALNRKGWA